MHTPWTMYIQMSLLFVVLTAAIGFHYWYRGLHRHPEETTWHVPVADPQRGRILVQRSGCAACHTIPGTGLATGNVGPKLDALHQQIYLPGGLPHTPQNLVVWIQRPRTISPQTAMPNLNLSEQDARDIAAYLYAAQE